MVTFDAEVRMGSPTAGGQYSQGVNALTVHVRFVLARDLIFRTSSAYRCHRAHLLSFVDVSLYIHIGFQLGAALGTSLVHIHYGSAILVRPTRPAALRFVRAMWGCPHGVRSSVRVVGTFWLMCVIY